MVYWYNKGLRNFFFVDDNFTMNKARIMKFCQLIIDGKMQNLTLSVPQGVRADKVDLELLTKMKDAGFWYLSFGVEAGNNKILKKIKKHETIEEIEKGILLATNLGFEIGLFFILGHPTETPDDFEDSLKIAMKYPVSSVDFFHAIPLPKTELYNWVKDNNFLSDNFDKKLRTFNFQNFNHNQPFFSTPDFTLDQRKEAFRKAKRIEKLVKRKNLEKNLYTKFGVSAKIISNFLYNPLLYRKIQKFYYHRFSRKLIDAIIQKFELEIHQF